MSRYEYDEEASAAWHMDVLHEVDDSPELIADQFGVEYPRGSSSDHT